MTLNDLITPWSVFAFILFLTLIHNIQRANEAERKIEVYKTKLRGEIERIDRETL